MSQEQRYKEQTAEDLENVPPMSGMQKAILVVAALIFAAVVAYIAFM